MFFLYNLIYLAILPILIVRDLFVLDKDKLKTIYQKLGNGIPQNNQPTVWMHGVSLGEVKILSPLAKKLESKGLKILITSTTNTGLKQIQNTFSNSNISVLPFPYDLSFAHQKIIKNFKVEKIILFESEFWPNLINSARDTKLVSLNTTISDGSFERFMALKPIVKKIFSKIDLFLAQSHQTVERLKLFEVSKVKLLGNIKNNAENYVVDQEKKLQYQKLLGDTKLNVVLGSSHDGEEVFVLKALCDLDINLVLAPRHPERIAKVVQEIKQLGFSGIKISDLSFKDDLKLGEKDILVFDKVGDLINLYAAADLAIVAGSIKFTKGHNFMEPIFVDTLSITGSKLDNYKQLKEELCDTNVIETFEDEGQLIDLVSKYKNKIIRQEKLKDQKNVLTTKSGTYDEIIKFLDEL